VEHKEDLDNTEQEIRERVDSLEEQGDQLDERKQGFEQNVRETREDFKQKQEAGDVPGAQKEDEMTEGLESDQLPEEGPGAVDDDGQGDRDEAQESAGGAGDEGQATGNPPQDDSADEDSDDDDG
jgi:hypothetical protein